MWRIWSTSRIRVLKHLSREGLPVLVSLQAQVGSITVFQSDLLTDFGQQTRARTVGRGLQRKGRSRNLIDGHGTLTNDRCFLADLTLPHYRYVLELVKALSSSFGSFYLKVNRRTLGANEPNI